MQTACLVQSPRRGGVAAPLDSAAGQLLATRIGGIRWVGSGAGLRVQMPPTAARGL